MVEIIGRKTQTFKKEELRQIEVVVGVPKTSIPIFFVVVCLGDDPEQLHISMDEVDLDYPKMPDEVRTTVLNSIIEAAKMELSREKN